MPNVKPIFVYAANGTTTAPPTSGANSTFSDVNIQKVGGRKQISAHDVILIVLALGVILWLEGS